MIFTFLPHDTNALNAQTAVQYATLNDTWIPLVNLTAKR
jgi:hypothetical protein